MKSCAVENFEIFVRVGIDITRLYRYKLEHSIPLRGVSCPAQPWKLGNTRKECYDLNSKYDSVAID
jgi:hypothetical protein